MMREGKVAGAKNKKQLKTREDKAWNHGCPGDVCRYLSSGGWVLIANQEEGPRCGASAGWGTST